MRSLWYRSGALVPAPFQDGRPVIRQHVPDPRLNDVSAWLGRRLSPRERYGHLLADGRTRREALLYLPAGKKPTAENLRDVEEALSR